MYLKPDYPEREEPFKAREWEEEVVERLQATYEEAARRIARAPTFRPPPLTEKSLSEQAEGYWSQWIGILTGGGGQPLGQGYTALLALRENLRARVQDLPRREARAAMQEGLRSAEEGKLRREVSGTLGLQEPERDAFARHARWMAHHHLKLRMGHLRTTLATMHFRLHLLETFIESFEVWGRVDQWQDLPPADVLEDLYGRRAKLHLKAAHDLIGQDENITGIMSYCGAIADRVTFPDGAVPTGRQVYAWFRDRGFFADKAFTARRRRIEAEAVRYADLWVRS